MHSWRSFSNYKARCRQLAKRIELQHHPVILIHVKAASDYLQQFQIQSRNLQGTLHFNSTTAKAQVTFRQLWQLHIAQNPWNNKAWTIAVSPKKLFCWQKTKTGFIGRPRYGSSSFRFNLGFETPIRSDNFHRLERQTKHKPLCYLIFHIT